MVIFVMRVMTTPLCSSNPREYMQCRYFHARQLSLIVHAQDTPSPMGNAGAQCPCSTCCSPASLHQIMFVPSKLQQWQ